MYTTLKQITGNIKSYGVKATSIEGQNDFAQKHALHKIYALINVKPAGGRQGKRWEFDIFQKINLPSNFLNKMKCEDKTVKFSQLSLALILMFDLHDFQTVRCMREREMSDRYQSLSSESVVTYPHVRRRKIQISPPPGEQDQANAPLVPKGQPPPHAMPHLPPPALH